VQAQLADQVDGLGDHPGDDVVAEVFLGHLGVGVQLGQGLAGGVGVDGAHRALMPGVHRVQHVQGLGAADLPDDDPLRPHPQRLADQLADADLPHPLQVGEPTLQPDAVLQMPLQRQFLGFLDGDHPLPGRDLAGDRVQGGGLPGPGAAGDQQVQPRPHRRPKQPSDLGGEGAERQQVLEGVGQEPVAADRQARVRRQRRADHMQPAPVRQPGVGFGVGLIQAAAGDRDGAGGERPQLRLRGEPGGDAVLGAAGANDEGVLVPIDEEFLDVVAGEVAFQGAKPEQRVEHRPGHLFPLVVVEGGVAGQDVVAVGLGQPLADRRPHQRPVILRWGEQPRWAQPVGKLGGCGPPHLRDQPRRHGGREGIGGLEVGGAAHAGHGGVAASPGPNAPRRPRVWRRDARPPAGCSCAASAV